MVRRLIVLVALSWVSAMPVGTVPYANAAGPAPLVLQYRIEHPIYGDIGSYTNSIIRAGDTITVHTSARILVKVLGIVLYRETTDRTERWQGGRLMSFHSATDKNGRASNVTGAADGNAFVVKGPAGTFRAPADVQPPNVWSARCLRADTMLSSVSGRVFRARIVDHGQATVPVDGQNRSAHEYEVMTDRPHDVWFDDAGVPLQIKSIEEGQPVRLVLTHYPDQGTLIAAAPPR